jgi:hypothetical protein
LAAMLLDNWIDTLTAFCRVVPAVAGAIAARPSTEPARRRA